MDLDFSIIVPTYRRPAKLEACLGALARQSFPVDRFEVIVCDDGGGGLENLRAFADRAFRRCTFVSQPRSGPAAARNHGARIASARFLAFTDDDCEPSPGWLDAFGETLGSHPEALVGGHTVNALPGNRFAAASQQLVDFLYAAYPSGSNGRFFCSNNFTVSRTKFATLGGFDAAFSRPGGEDRDFCSRWTSRGGSLVVSSTAVVQHSHALTLGGFWNQHFRYGQGAQQLRRRMQQTGRPMLRIEPPAFYLRLMAYPFANGTQDRMTVATLMALSQAANACGFLREALRPTSQART